MNKDQQTIEILDTVNEYLDSLSDDQLRAIINDTDQESQLEELLLKCPIVPKLTQEKESLIAKNKTIANQNYNREPTYNELRKVLEEEHKQGVALKQRLFEKQTKINKLRPKMLPDTLRGLLQIAAQESEEESEEIAKQFLAKEKTYETFIKEFIEKRTQYHVRRIKYEKLIDSIRNPQNTNQNSSFSHNTHHQATNLVSPTQMPASLPYASSSYTNAPFAYPPLFHSSTVQPIRSAPLPPHMSMDLPPYPTPQHTPYPGQNVYMPPNQNLPSFPFNMNPNFR